MPTLYSDNWQIDNVEAVFWDKDGTFINPDAYWGKLCELRIEKIISFFNLPQNMYDDVAYIIGYDVLNKKLIPNGPVAVLSRNEVIDILLNYLLEINIKTDFSQIDLLFNEVHNDFLNNASNYTELLDGAVECFERMFNFGIKMAVITSDSYEHTVKTLTDLKINKYFDLVLGKDSCKAPKKTGEPAILALNKMNLYSQNVVVIGDAPMDYLMAENSGIKNVILTTTGHVPHKELSLMTNKVINSLNEIKVK